jgi:hypothetical protein
MGTPAESPLLDEARAAFIVDRVSINVASCSARLIPSLARANGCRVSPDRRHVALFLSAGRAAGLVSDLRAGGAIAAVFSLPSTHETLQLKGRRADVEPLEAGDRALMQAYAERFVHELRELGYDVGFARGLISGAMEECLAVSFEPVAAFVQTPGPNAGHRLDPKT